MAARASRIAKLAPGRCSRRRQAAPIPDRPAPMMSTSKCSAMAPVSTGAPRETCPGATHIYPCATARLSCGMDSMVRAASLRGLPPLVDGLGGDAGALLARFRVPAEALDSDDAVIPSGAATGI